VRRLVAAFLKALTSQRTPKSDRSTLIWLLFFVHGEQFGQYIFISAGTEIPLANGQYV